jgi:hypothetical protein
MAKNKKTEGRNDSDLLTIGGSSISSIIKATPSSRKPRVIYKPRSTAASKKKSLPNIKVMDGRATWQFSTDF